MVNNATEGRGGRDRMVSGYISEQSVPITNKVVSSNPAHGEVYLIQHSFLSVATGR